MLTHVVKVRMTLNFNHEIHDYKKYVNYVSSNNGIWTWIRSTLLLCCCVACYFILLIINCMFVVSVDFKYCLLINVLMSMTHTQCDTLTRDSYYSWKLFVKSAQKFDSTNLESTISRFWKSLESVAYQLKPISRLSLLDFTFERLTFPNVWFDISFCIAMFIFILCVLLLCVVCRFLLTLVI